jgi:hypothetical protein
MIYRYITLVLLTWIPSAYAYVDPGVSLFLIQGLLAALVSVVVFIRHPIEGIKKILKKIIK